MERLVRITAEKLFGYLDQDVSLASNEGVTILHGANGSGKTTILRAIRELSHRPPVTLSTVPFDSFSLHFESGSVLTVRHSDDKCTLHLNDSDTHKWTFGKQHPERLLRKYMRRGPRSQSEFEFVEFMREADDLPPHLLMEWLHSLPIDFPLEGEDVPEWLTTFWGSFHCTLVEEQRLLKLEPFRHRHGPRFTRAVTEFSEHLSSLIADALRQYGAKSQTLDRSFPQRIVQTFDRSAPNVGDVQQQYAQIEELRDSLRKASLLEPESEMFPLNEDSLNSEPIRKVLYLYAEDMKNKLSLFDDLFRRISLFKELINDYFTHKVVAVTRNGFHFETETGDTLSPTSLSSGEQHILVLFFTLIFRAPRQTHLVLIDEPELSLHPRWQFRLVDDLLRIRDVSSTDFILASHSPQIFEGHWDMARDLNA